ncbi:unnamed protein product [Discosporangium mesarthrocarpum]
MLWNANVVKRGVTHFIRKTSLPKCDPRTFRIDRVVENREYACLFCITTPLFFPFYPRTLDALDVLDKIPKVCCVVLCCFPALRDREEEISERAASQRIPPNDCGSFLILFLFLFLFLFLSGVRVLLDVPDNLRSPP